MGRSTSAMIKVNGNILFKPKSTFKNFEPKVLMVDPLAAESNKPGSCFLTLQRELGTTETSAPVSIRNERRFTLSKI